MRARESRVWPRILGLNSNLCFVSEGFCLGVAGFLCVCVHQLEGLNAEEKATAFYGELGWFRGKDKIASWMLKIAFRLFSAHGDNCRV